MEINFLVRVSVRMDLFYRVKLFHRSSKIVFSNNEAPESDKIGIWQFSSVGMGFMQQM